MRVIVRQDRIFLNTVEVGGAKLKGGSSEGFLHISWSPEGVQGHVAGMPCDLQD